MFYLLCLQVGLNVGVTFLHTRRLWNFQGYFLLNGKNKTHSYTTLKAILKGVSVGRCYHRLVGRQVYHILVTQQPLLEPHVFAGEIKLGEHGSGILKVVRKDKTAFSRRTLSKFMGEILLLNIHNTYFCLCFENSCDQILYPPNLSLYLRFFIKISFCLYIYMKKNFFLVTEAN